MTPPVLAVELGPGGGVLEAVERKSTDLEMQLTGSALGLETTGGKGFYGWEQ